MQLSPTLEKQRGRKKKSWEGGINGGNYIYERIFLSGLMVRCSPTTINSLSLSIDIILYPWLLLSFLDCHSNSFSSSTITCIYHDLVKFTHHFPFMVDRISSTLVCSPQVHKAPFSSQHVNSWSYWMPTPVLGLPLSSLIHVGRKGEKKSYILPSSSFTFMFTFESPARQNYSSTWPIFAYVTG